MAQPQSSDVYQKGLDFINGDFGFPQSELLQVFQPPLICIIVNIKM